MHTLFHGHRHRALVGLSLMGAQAFFYNAIFFTYALVLTDFYCVPAERIGWYILPFAAGNFLGPLLLGRLFDVLGRRTMIAFTYIVSGILLGGSGQLFAQGMLTATGNVRLDYHFLFCFGRCELGLSDGQRDLPAGDPRACDCVLLRARHRHRRDCGSLAVRGVDRHRLAHERVRGLPARRRFDGCGRRDRCGVLRASGTKAA